MVKRYNSYVNEVILPEDKEQNHLLETISNPNFSIVAPGGCNGKCEFCFWKNDKACGNYMEGLTETLGSLPSQFYQLSITGGEPTLSPYLSEILESIDTEKWTHTILTTNGINLKKFIPQLEGKVQHVNISRHHWKDELNEDVFGTNTVPSHKELRVLVQELNAVGIDVTYSAVLTEHLDDKEEIKKFLKFARSHGASQVFLRKQHGTLDPSTVEKAFEHLEQSHHYCPVCRNTTQYINETKVIWKASLEEPSAELGAIYELVYNQNGVLTSDWEQNLIVESSKIKDDGDYVLLEGCGSSGGGCGGSSKDASLSEEDIEALIRMEKLKDRKKKVKKVVDKVKKDLAEDSKVEPNDELEDTDD